jgi:hypothetical protein
LPLSRANDLIKTTAWLLAAVSARATEFSRGFKGKISKAAMMALKNNTFIFFMKLFID